MEVRTLDNGSYCSQRKITEFKIIGYIMIAVKDKDDPTYKLLLSQK